MRGAVDAHDRVEPAVRDPGGAVWSDDHPVRRGPGPERHALHLAAGGVEEPEGLRVPGPCTRPARPARPRRRAGDRRRRPGTPPARARPSPWAPAARPPSPWAVALGLPWTLASRWRVRPSWPAGPAPARRSRWGPRRSSGSPAGCSPAPPPAAGCRPPPRAARRPALPSGAHPSLHSRTRAAPVARHRRMGGGGDVTAESVGFEPTRVKDPTATPRPRHRPN